MARFAYVAFDQDGKETRGIVESDCQKNALADLSRQGLFPTSCHEAHVGDDIAMNVRERLEEERKRREDDEAKRHAEIRKKHPRQRLVVHYKDGRLIYGVTFRINPAEDGFHLDLTDKEGHTQEKGEKVVFSDIKAVFYVRAFDGKFDKAEPRPQVATNGPQLVVEFQDGEILKGTAVHDYNENHPRFYVVPINEQSNNYSILVERSAIANVMTPEQYHEYKKAKRETQKEEGKAENLSQEETMGDFYFETRDYGSALAQYEVAISNGESNERLKRKMVVAKYNVGMQFVKRRQYPRALSIMEEVLEMDPRNDHARRKAKKLRKIIDHEERGEEEEF